MTFSPWLQGWQSATKELSSQRRVCFSPNLKAQSQTLLFLGRVEPAQPSPGSCQRGRFSAALSGRGGHWLGEGRGSLCFMSHRPGQGGVTPRGSYPSGCSSRAVRPPDLGRCLGEQCGNCTTRPGIQPRTLFFVVPCSAFNTGGCRLTGYAPLPFLATQRSGWRLQDELPPKRLCACVAPPKPRPLPVAPPSYPGLRR